MEAIDKYSIISLIAAILYILIGLIGFAVR
jgi:preprotein translocase subunit Sss1